MCNNLKLHNFCSNKYTILNKHIRDDNNDEAL